MRASSCPSSPVAAKKKVARKWSEEEVAALVAAINRVATSSELLNWADIAKAVPGRTGKQCREKYKVGISALSTVDGGCF